MPHLSSVIEDSLRQMGVHPDAPLVAAVSGGPDSVALLRCIGQTESLRKRTCVGHVDHGLRPESAAEATFVAELSESLGISFHTTRLDIDPAAGGNLSARLRDARYDFLLRLVPPGGFLLTAHHADDQAVTLLMRLFEGASLPGLAGIQQRRENIVRPLLQVPRSEILAYLQFHNFPFCQDPSNLDESRYRNRVRQQVWSPIVARDPGAGRRLALAASRMREDDDALQHWADLTLTQSKGAANWVEVPLGADVPPAVLRRILNSVLAARWKCGPLSGEQWPTIVADLHKGRRASLPGRVAVQKTAGMLVFVSQQPVLEYKLDIREPGDYVLPVGVLQVGESPRGTDGPATIQIRGLKPGDRVFRDGSMPPTGIQDWLKKWGVPRHKRAGWPVVPHASGGITPAFPSQSPPENDDFKAAGGVFALRFKSELSEGIQGLKELAQKL